jgi:hypothetical protein
VTLEVEGKKKTVIRNFKDPGIKSRSLVYRTLENKWKTGNEISN